jgi:tetratricopeptide (TPR) repeat protein
MKLNTTVSRIALSLALALGVAGAGMIASPVAMAAEKPPTVSAAVGKPLTEAMNLLKGGKAKEAQVEAQKAAAASKTPYEQLVSNQILINASLKATDYTTAAKAIEAAIATGQLKPEETIAFNKTLTQIYYQQKNYPKTIEAAQNYLKVVPGDAESSVLIGQSYYLQNDFKKSSDFLKSYIKASDAAGKPVKEDTLTLLMSADYKLNDDAAVRSDLEMLQTRYPKPQYLKDFIAMTEKSLRQNNASTKTTLDIFAVKFNAGLLTEPKDYAGLAELALQDGLPGLAKKVMDKGMADGILGTGAQKDRELRMAGMAKTQSDTDQKGLAAGEAEAAKAKTGEALIKYGEAYATYGMFDKAVAATEAGVAKGVADKDDGQLRLGIVYMQAGQRAKALEAFKQITPGSASAQVAALWRLQK